VKEKPWSEEERVLLDKWAHLSLTAIQRKLKQAGSHRTETAIKLKMRRALLGKDTLDYYSATKIAQAMGIDGHKVAGWIRRGWLRAIKKGTERTPQTRRRRFPRASQRAPALPALSSRRV
jgi:hypothetical protein